MARTRYHAILRGHRFSKRLTIPALRNIGSARYVGVRLESSSGLLLGCAYLFRSGVCEFEKSWCHGGIASRGWVGAAQSYCLSQKRGQNDSKTQPLWDYYVVTL
eukprot:553492-Amphidinium_carterae.1